MNVLIYEVLMTVFFDGVKIPTGSTIVFYNGNASWRPEDQKDSFHKDLGKFDSDTFSKNPDVFKRIY